MFCCDGFRSLVSLAGERGLAILVRKDNHGVLSCVVQSRGVSLHDQRLLEAGERINVNNLNIKVNIATAIPLQYCPACGCDLRLQILSYCGFYQNLARDHRAFFDGLPTF